MRISDKTYILQWHKSFTSVVRLFDDGIALHMIASLCILTTEIDVGTAEIFFVLKRNKPRQWRRLVIFIYERDSMLIFIFFFSAIRICVGWLWASEPYTTHTQYTNNVHNVWVFWEVSTLSGLDDFFLYRWCYSTTIDELNTSIECEVSEWWMDHFLAVQKNVWANTNLLFAFNSCENYFLMALFNSTAIQSALRMLSHHDRRIFSTCFHQVQKVRHSKWYHGISCA